jgi:site-specific DNA-methyltransferase (adenine-specific)
MTTITNTNSVTVICADSRAEIITMPSNTYDLIVLDPDYQDWSNLCDTGFIEQAMRVLKDTGNIICFTKQPFDHDLRCYVDKYFRREMIWSFTNGGAWVSKKMPLVSFQKMFWLTKTKNFYVNVRTGVDYPDTTRSFKRSSKQFGGWVDEGQHFEKSDDGLWIRDHFHMNKPHTGAIPSKPDELIRIIVNCFSPTDGIVLDPFWGSGTTGRVCAKLGRTVTGIDISDERAKQSHKSSNIY